MEWNLQISHDLVLHYIVLQSLLHNSDGLRIAIIVNDMSEVNIDANLLVSSVQAEEKMVALSNGCICCTLREDLFVELAGLAARGDLDHVIVESSGISEPLPVAETFTFRDGQGTSLGDVAKLDTLVTVVDGFSFLDELYAVEELRDRAWHVSKEDDRTVAQLFCDQLEFANVIVMNKIDLLDDTEKAQLSAILRRFNPSAQLIEAAWGRVEPRRLLGTGLFDLAQAEQHPDWLKEARVGEHSPETIEYGISSITFRSRRPFNVQRFDELTVAMENKRTRLIKRDSDEEEKKKEQEDFPLPTTSVSKASHRAAQCVIRSKGLVWLANQQSHWQQCTASLAGRRFTLSFGVPWSAAITGGSEPQDALAPEIMLWQKPWGDRRTELVVIGQDMDHAEITAALEACVLTDDEMDKYTNMFLEAQPLDVLGERAVGSDDDLTERLKRFEIEILAPKKKKTQVLEAAPKSTEPISAHSCIAVFQGGARFRVKQYLRYAHIFPELASGLAKEFELPIAAMDTQTALLADQTNEDNTLSNTVAHLKGGDKVELEWLQIRVEMETDIDEDRYSIIEQCQKLTKLDEKAEKALMREYPRPQIMIRKDQMAGESCNVDEHQEEGYKEKKTNKGKKKGRKKGRKRG
jgi:G3E family GTPase